ncbi:MAG TPA: type II toxin-antitoxin system Phd/YefM family antitoxin, partial [Thermomicrobiales bacterium]|nr:type II toxin-antitoxin system Phd/YefM family antitoxin [Thermomicrobiales bacterium]
VEPRGRLQPPGASPHNHGCSPYAAMRAAIGDMAPTRCYTGQKYGAILVSSRAWEGAMPKTVSASEAKNSLGALIRWVRESGDAVIVENHGQPRVVILSAEEYADYEALKEQRRRQEALATMHRLQAAVSARNRDLTPEQADELADRITRDAIESLIERGVVRYER